ncbi:Exocyst complex component 8 [Portunus trituberculatus]|uniref:Exocyst complex component 8 n=1 Tax=Portunus trituberculatus TaxID=210409 RepID=A0A5B7EG38_PORTR|nr:Exocyst complex component 8 [Portunus trituberculatus]
MNPPGRALLVMVRSGHSGIEVATAWRGAPNTPSTKRGPVRYEFEVLYPLDQVLPVNIKDRGNTKNAFKVLIFPDTRVFMAPTAKSKPILNHHDENQRCT